MSSVLKGIRVLDCGRFVAGPYCAAVLGDFGADVIRVDRVGGSEDRTVMAVTSGGEGALFLQCNRNKRSVTLDMDSAQGREVLRKLVASVDVVVANMPQPTLMALGLDYDSLCAVRPDIILTVASAYGSGGPQAGRTGFDGVGQALSGAVHLSGQPGHPTKAMVQPVDFAAAMSCAMGTVMALYERQKSGRGQIVEGSLLHAALMQAAGPLIEEAARGIGREAIGNRSPISGPSDIFRVRDGWIIVQVVGDPIFRRWARLVGRSELIEDPRFRSDRHRGDHGEVLSEIMSGWCESRTSAEALRDLDAAKIPGGPVYSPRQALADGHIRAAGFLAEVDYPGLPRGTPLVTTPAKLSRTPAEISLRPPLAGEHTDAILGEVGYDAAAIAELRRARVV